MGATIIKQEKGPAVFINKPDYDMYIRQAHTDGETQTTVVQMFPKKTRGICIEGVMSNRVCYHVILDRAYLEYFQTLSLKGNRIPTVIADLFPGETIFVRSEETYHCLYTGNKYNNDDVTYEFDVYKLEDFVMEKPTKKEQERKKQEDSRKKTEQFNTTLVKDTVIKVLEDAGIYIHHNKNTWLNNGRAYFCAASKTDWNALVLKAINEYLNSIGKQHGFRIKQPKYRADANIDYKKPLFFTDSIEIIEQEQDNH